MGIEIVKAGSGIQWACAGAWPSTMIAATDAVLRPSETGTHFGFVSDGGAVLESEQGRFELRSGMYFSVPGPMECHVQGSAFVVTRLGWRGFFQIGGPVEEQGRLRYIDGCSDSLLISPVVLGDPCLNLLYLPPETRQTAHTHPSSRFGMIVSGSGVCRTPTGDIPLCPQMAFHIPAETMHSFHTQASALRVIAWHPDSDCGPAHHDHPMINRTIIEGLPASRRLLKSQWESTE